jgi:DNA-binding beta-propeller fold protein YncE
MLEERKASIEDGQVRDKNEFVTADVNLDACDQVVECDTTSAAITVTLPPVHEAQGKIYTIALVTDGGSNVTIADRNDSYNWDGDYTLGDADDAYILYSNGRQWYVLATIGI